MRDDIWLVALDDASLAGRSMLSPERPRVSSIARVDTLDRHRSISGVASEVCKRVATSGVSDDRELEEGSVFEDTRLPWDRSEGMPSTGKGFEGLVRVTFIHSSLGVTSSMAVTSKKSSKLRGRPLCMRWGLLVPSRKRGSRIFNCGGVRCMAGSKTATGPLTVSVVHYRESDVRIDTRVSSNHVRHNAAQIVSISSYADGGVCRICDG